MTATTHNHMTRDIKPRGQCPKCDEHPERQGVVDLMDALLDSVERARQERKNGGAP